MGTHMNPPKALIQGAQTLKLEHLGSLLSRLESSSTKALKDLDHHRPRRSNPNTAGLSLSTLATFGPSERSLKRERAKATHYVGTIGASGERAGCQPKRPACGRGIRTNSEWCGYLR
jgi:hypothetical protein